MRSLSLVALVVALAAANLRSDEELRGRHWHHKHMPLYEQVDDREYEQNKEYLYEYNGQLMTGIPQTSEQHSATRIQALIKIIFKTQQKAVMKIEKVRFGYFNDKVAQPRFVHDFDLFEQVSIDEEKKSLLMQPLEFTYEQGLVQEVYFTEDEQPWSANIKRAVLNLMQVNVNKQRRLDTHTTLRNIQSSSSESREWTDNQTGEFEDFFTVMENTMEGECETAYTMLKTGEQQVNVTKTINFDNCPRRPNIRYNHRFHKVCTTCWQQYEEDKFAQASTVIRQQVFVDSSKVLVKNADTESFYTIVPITEEGNLMQTYVLSTLRLVKKQHVQENSIMSRDFSIKSDSGLIYTLDWDVLKEKYFQNGEEQLFQENTPFPEIKNSVEFVKSIVQKLVHYMRESVEEEAPRQFVRLVKSLRLCTKQQLEQVMREFYFEMPEEFTREEQHKIKSLIVDALAIAGTQSSVEQIVELVKERKITPIKASMVIRKLQSVRVISEKMIENIWELTSEEYREKAPVTIYQAAYLTVGSLLNGHCQAELDKLATSFNNERMCTRQIKQKWTQKLVRRFEECDADLCRITVLKTIANAGLDQSINDIEKIILNRRRYSPLIRVEAILATRQLLEIMPRKVEKVLMPVYMNKRELPVVRMTAFFKLIQSQPDKFIIDQLTHSLYKEPNKQVAAFVYTTMQQFANETNPCLERMSNDLKLSLRHARSLPVNEWMHKSHVHRMEVFPQQSSNGFVWDLHKLMSNNSILPMDVAATLRVNVNKQWYRNAFQVGVMQQNVEQYLRYLVRRWSHNMQPQGLNTAFDDITEGRWSEEQTSPKFRKELTDIFDDLSIEDREQEWQSQDDKQSLAYLYFRIMNQDYGFLPLSKEILPEQLLDILTSESVSLRKLLKNGERMLKDQELTMPFDVSTGTQVHEMQKKIPTTLGMPLVWTVKVPLVAQARGNLKLKIDRDAKKVELELIDFKPSSVITYVSKVECWTPIVNSGLKIVAQKKIYAPITMKIEAQLQNERPIVKMLIKPTEKKYELIRIQTRPVTLVRVWPKHFTQYQEPEERTIQGEQSTRLVQGRKSFGEQSLGIKFETQYLMHTQPLRHIQGTPMPLFAGPNKMVVRVEPGMDMPREIEFVATGSLFNKLAKTSLKPEFDSFYEESDEYLRDETTDDQYYKQYESEQPTQHMLKISVQGKGSRVERRAQLTADCRLASESRRAGKCELVIKRTPVPEVESEEWQLKKTVEFLYPQAKAVDELTNNKNNRMMVRVNAQWGETSKQDKRVDIKIVGEQSRLMKELVEQSIYRRQSMQSERQSLFSPVAQYEHVQRLSVLDQFKADVDYENVPLFVKNQTEKMLDLVKAYYYMQTEIDHQPRDSSFKKGQLRVQLNLDPISLQAVNVSIEMPREKVLIKDIPLAYPVVAYTMPRMSTPSKNFYQMITNTVSDYANNMCKVRNDRVETFDEVKYKAPISTCYSLIAKDCTRQSKFAVLVKRLGESTERKQIKIVSANVQLIVKPKQQSGDNIELEYILNGEKKNIRELEKILAHETHEILSVMEEETGYARISLPEAGVRVYFDGYSTNVKASSYHGQRLCGLCGQLEPEQWEQECELRDADNECVSVNSKKDLKRLFKSFVHDDDECTQEQQKYHSHEDKYEWEPLQWEEPQFKSIEEQWTDDEYRTEIQPRQETRVIEQLHEVCFSKQPVLRCPKNTQTVEHANGHVKVVYSCINRNDFETEEYLRQARQGRVVVDVQELPASFTQSEKIPKVCEKIQY